MENAVGSRHEDKKIGEITYKSADWAREDYGVGEKTFKALCMALLEKGVFFGMEPDRSFFEEEVWINA